MLLDEIIRAKLSYPGSESALLGNLVHPADAGRDYIHSETYLWYRAVSEALKPSRILEIGTRFGYSLKSLVLGSGKVDEVWAFDNESSCQGSNKYVQSYFRCYFPEVKLHTESANTRSLKSLRLPSLVDLAHVDADHTREGCYEDCCLAIQSVRLGGIIVVDDVRVPNYGEEVRAGADRFCREKGFAPVYLDCFRGMYLIEISRQENT